MTTPNPPPTPERAKPTGPEESEFRKGYFRRLGESTADEEVARKRKAQEAREKKPPSRTQAFKRGMDIGKKVQQHTAQTVPNAAGNLVWQPDPSTILVVGGGLVLANIAVDSNSKNLIDFLWNTTPVGRALNVGGWATILGELGFVFFLYIVGAVYPPATKPILVFLFGLWLIWFIFLGPKLLRIMPRFGK